MNKIKTERRGRGKFTPIKASEVNILKCISESIDKEDVNTEEFGNTDEEDAEFCKEESKWSVISLFSGCGGMDIGLSIASLINKLDDVDKYNSDKQIFVDDMERNSSINIIYAIDNFKDAIETHKLNNISPNAKYNTEDIRKIKKFPKCDMVIGGFPCPGFSLAGPRLLDDERNYLYIHFIRVLEQSKPKIFVAENVKGLLTIGEGLVFKQMKKEFADAGYKIYTKLVNSVDFGVPQIRERVFIVGIRNDVDFEYKFPTATHGNNSNPIKNLKDAIYDIKDNPGPFYDGDYSSMYLSRNRKKKWDEPSFTIQASGRHAPLHPDGPQMKKISTDKWIIPKDVKQRRLSIKEIARIQTFPDWFEFYTEKKKKTSENGKLDKIYKQIGNAIPVLLVVNIMLPIIKYINSSKKKRKLEENDEDTDFKLKKFKSE